MLYIIISLCILLKGGLYLRYSFCTAVALADVGRNYRPKYIVVNMINKLI